MQNTQPIRLRQMRDNCEAIGLRGSPREQPLLDLGRGRIEKAVA